MLKIIQSIALISILISFQAKALDQYEALDFVSEMTQEVTLLLQDSNLSKTQYLSAINSILKKRLDTPVVAQYLLSSYSRNIDDKTRHDFIQSLEEYVTLVYGLRLRAYYRGEVVKVHQAIKTGKTFLVHTSVTSTDGNGAIPVTWKIHNNKNKKTKVIDIIVNNVSMSISQREEFTSIIRKNNNQVSALIENIKKSQIKCDKNTSTKPNLMRKYHAQR